MDAAGGKSLANPLPYLEYVHPREISEYLSHEEDLRSLLQSIPLPKSIFTNSPHFHADRILHFFGIKDCFEQVFDLLFNKLEGKPQASSYQRVLDTLGIPAKQVLFIDDVPSYLEGFLNIGGNCLLVDENKRYNDPRFLQIQNIHELPNLLRDMNSIM
jgi:putative hydrolase of the HAD superfamily